jgi:hypothetical protein
MTPEKEIARLRALARTPEKATRMAIREAICVELCARIARIGHELQKAPQALLVKELADSALILAHTAQSILGGARHRNGERSHDA